MRNYLLGGATVVVIAIVCQITGWLPVFLVLRP
jgi:hypothetical protein